MRTLPGLLHATLGMFTFMIPGPADYPSPAPEPRRRTDPFLGLRPREQEGPVVDGTPESKRARRRRLAREERS